MSSSAPGSKPPPDRSRRSRKRRSILPWPFILDVMTFAAWGTLLVHHWLTGKLNLLIHPNYHWLVVATGTVLLVIACLRLLQMVQLRRQGRSLMPAGNHVSLFPRYWSGILLLTAAIAGLSIAPRAFTSQTAIQRGVSDFLPPTRSQPQAFRSASRPEERTLVEWVRTLSVYPDPDTYVGQKVNVIGFVVYPPNNQLPEEYFLLSRFVVTCCAADAYPVGLPVKLTENRKAYPPDTWLEVAGQMIAEERGGNRQLTIQASALKKVPQPEKPYEY